MGLVCRENKTDLYFRECTLQQVTLKYYLFKNSSHLKTEYAIGILKLCQITR